MAGKNTKSINIDKELHKETKIVAAKRDMKIRDLVEAALRSFLDMERNENKG